MNDERKVCLPWLWTCRAGWRVRWVLPSPCLIPVPWHFLSAPNGGQWLLLDGVGGPVLVQGLTIKTFSSCLALLFKHPTGAGSPAKLPNAAVHLIHGREHYRWDTGPSTGMALGAILVGVGGLPGWTSSAGCTFRRPELRAEASHCAEGREP